MFNKLNMDYTNGLFPYRIKPAGSRLFIFLSIFQVRDARREGKIESGGVFVILSFLSKNEQKKNV